MSGNIFIWVIIMAECQGILYSCIIIPAQVFNDLRTTPYFTPPYFRERQVWAPEGGRRNGQVSKDWQGFSIHSELL